MKPLFLAILLALLPTTAGAQLQPTLGDIATGLHRQHPLYRGTIGHWIFNEGGGTAVYDASGNARNGAFAGGPIWTTGKFGRGLDFAGGANDYITVSNTFGNPTSISCAAWVKRDTSVNDNDIITAVGDGLSLRPTHGASGGNPAFIIKTNVNFFTAGASSIVATGTWYRLAGTYDGATTIKVFVNGVLMGSTTGASGTLTTWSTFYIGRATGSGRFDGVAEDVRCWNRALTEGEVFADYSQPFIEFAQPFVAFSAEQIAAARRRRAPVFLR